MATRDRPNGFWQNDDNVREYMTRLQAVLGYQVMEDWYKITKKDFENNDGSGLLSNRFKNSRMQLLQHVYPEYEWLPWLFHRAPNSTWQNDNTIKVYMVWLGKKLNYTTLEDWFQVSQRDFVKNGGGGVLDYFNGSPTQILHHVYPDHVWLPWLFKFAPKNTWTTESTIKDYMVWLGNRLGYTKMEDWYNIKQRDFLDNHGESLLANCFNSSPICVLCHVYPEHSWLPWLFKMSPMSTWETDTTIKAYVAWLGQKLGYTKMEDWYNIKQRDFHDNNAGGLIKKFNGSPIQLLRHVYPEYQWLPWLFNAPNNTWTTMSTIKEYTAWLGDRLGYTKIDDWYNISVNDLINNYGGGLLDRFGGSPIRILRHVYSETEWLPWLFNHTVRDTWGSDDRIKDYVVWLGQKLGYTNMEDWHQVSLNDFHINDGFGLINNFNGSPIQLLQYVYPEVEWNAADFKSYKMQAEIYRQLKKLIPDLEYEYRHDDLRFMLSGFRMTSDMFSPSLRLSIEVQGEQHYEPVAFFGGEARHHEVLRRDAEKREKFHNAGIIAIEVPYWRWDGNGNTLIVELLEEYYLRDQESINELAA